MKFVTVTLNPSLDRTVVTQYLCVGYRNAVQGPVRLDPAGRGVNISRALHQLNCNVHSIILLRNDTTGLVYQTLVAEEGFDITCIKAEGSTQTNTIILDTGNDSETQIIEEATAFDQDTFQNVINTLQKMVAPNDVVILAGSLPHGVADDTYNRLLEAAHQVGARAAVVGGDATTQASLEAGPELCALSQLECESYSNHPIRVLDDILDFAHKLCDEGAKKVLIEMREKSRAVLVTKNGDEWEIDLPDALKGTSIGIWDAMVAGFLAGHAEKKPLDKSLELAAAAAAYAADQVGSEFGSTKEIKEYISDVDVTSL